MKRRLLSLILALVLVLGLIPVSVFADDGQADAEKTATAAETPAEEAAAEEDEIKEVADEDEIEEVIEEDEIEEDEIKEDEIEEPTEEETEEIVEDELCPHTETSTDYMAAEAEEKHFVTVTCVCGEELKQALVSCSDTDGDGFCDGCEVQLEVPVALGDVNADGIIDEEDAMCILRYVVGFSDDIDRELADVDGDGIISAIDATFILRYCAGKIEAFPAEE